MLPINNIEYNIEYSIYINKGGNQMQKELIHVLSRLSFYSSPITYKRLMEEVITDSKRLRNGLSKLEIDERGLNIYEKRGARVFDLIEFAVEAGHIVIIVLLGERTLLITPEGIEALICEYTNNRSSDFNSFESQINQAMKERKEPGLESLHVAAFFYKGFSVEKVVDLYKEKSAYREEREAYHRHMIALTGKDLSKELFVFHFNPKIFVPVEFVNEKVELVIEGFEVPNAMILTKPYLNKRYTVAGVQIGKEKSASGFYPIIGKKEDFSKQFEVTMKWLIGKKLTVIHRLLISFDFGEGLGNLFSTEQYLSRSNNLPSFNLTTYSEINPEFWRDRNVTKVYDLNTNTFIIEEIATLNLFPISLQSTFHGDLYFQKWMENEKK
jgi:hypothetical protein